MLVCKFVCKPTENLKILIINEIQNAYCWGKVSVSLGVCRMQALSPTLSTKLSTACVDNKVDGRHSKQLVQLSHVGLN
jgi:hypothetical protein